MMNANKDPLANSLTPDRVFYANGVMLDAEDFLAEQSYHRGRLARALAYLAGSGTLAGLRVEHRFSGESGSQVEELVVHGGLAIDRLGRVIEVPRDWCIRLDRWWLEQATSPDPQVVSDLVTAYKGAPMDGVVADVFIRFVPCERGKTPAFASGPFDALDAVQPSRLRDGFEVQLILRREGDLSQAVPAQNWPDLSGAGDAAARFGKLHEAILDAWPHDAVTDPKLEPWPEYAVDQADQTAVFLARVVIKATAPTAPGRPPERPDPPTPDSVTVDNNLRLFVYMPQALARAIVG